MYTMLPRKTVAIQADVDPATANPVLASKWL